MSLEAALALATHRVVAPIEGMHRVIAGRAFRAVGPLGAPVRLVHDAVTGTAYAAVRRAGAVVGAGLDRRSERDSSRGALAHAWVNGLWGDALGQHARDLETEMGVRGPDGAVVEGADGVACAFPGASGHLVVLVHGLVDTESCWRGTESRPGLAVPLDEHVALTPLTLRYNTGLAIAENGARLAGLLETLHAEWPVEVRSISLVGHSMGGLVIRSALTRALSQGHDWVDDVRRVVSVASPHRGAPLEKLVAAAALGLRVAATTRPLADFLDTRSAGITDLRFGAVTPGDWPAVDPRVVLLDTVSEHPLPSGVAHHVIAGVVTASATHPIGVVAGDLMVRPASSAAPRVEPTDVVVIGGVNHTNLLRSPLVVEHVLGWLEAHLEDVSPPASDSPSGEPPRPTP